jgi:hypothetical protein
VAVDKIIVQQSLLRADIARDHGGVAGGLGREDGFFVGAHRLCPFSAPVR